MSYSYDRSEPHTAAAKPPKGWPELPLTWDQAENLRKLPPLTYKGQKTQMGSKNNLDLWLEFGDVLVGVRPPLENHRNVWEGRAILDDNYGQMLYGDGKTFEDAVRQVLKHLRKREEEIVAYQKKRLAGFDNEYENAVQELKRKFDKQRESATELVKKSEGRLKTIK